MSSGLDRKRHSEPFIDDGESVSLQHDWSITCVCRIQLSLIPGGEPFMLDVSQQEAGVSSQLRVEIISSSFQFLIFVLGCSLQSYQNGVISLLLFILGRQAESKSCAHFTKQCQWVILIDWSSLLQEPELKLRLDTWAAHCRPAQEVEVNHFPILHTLCVLPVNKHHAARLQLHPLTCGFLTSCNLQNIL